MTSIGIGEEEGGGTVKWLISWVKIDMIEHRKIMI